MTRTGLTLLEVVVSAAILAAAAGALAGVASDASASARRALLTDTALDAFDRWREAVVFEGVDASAWRWTDARGGEWRITQEPLSGAGGGGGGESGGVRWVELRVERTDGSAAEFAPALILLRLAPPGSAVEAAP